MNNKSIKSNISLKKVYKVDIIYRTLYVMQSKYSDKVIKVEDRFHCLQENGYLD